MQIATVLNKNQWQKISADRMATTN